MGAECIPVHIFNKGACLQKQTHKNKGVTYRHICSHCWNKEGKYHFVWVRTLSVFHLPLYYYIKALTEYGKMYLKFFKRIG